MYKYQIKIYLVSTVRKESAERLLGKEGERAWFDSSLPDSSVL